MTSKRVAVQRLRDLARLRRMRDRIDRGCAQLLDVEALAHGVHMSAGHFQHALHRAGRNPCCPFDLGMP
jgi:AraC-like DNA-binding protein